MLQKFINKVTFKRATKPKKKIELKRKSETRTL